MVEPEVRDCEGCNEPFPTEELFEFDGQILCKDCKQTLEEEEEGDGEEKEEDGA